MILNKRFFSLFLFLLIFSLSFYKVEARPKKKIKHKNKVEYIVADTLDIYPLDEILDYKGSYTQYFDLLHTRLELTPSFKDKAIKGIATLKLTSHFYPQSELVLNAVGMSFDSILLSFDQFNSPAKYNYNGRLLSIELPQSVSRKDTFEVKIQYVARPDEVSSVLKGDGQGAYFINGNQTNPYRKIMFWTQGEPESSSFWFPTIEATNQRCSQEIFVTIPDTLVSISNGKLMEEVFHSDGTKTDYWKQDLTHSPYLFALVIGPFKKYQDKWKNKDVDYYALQEFYKDVQLVYGRTPEMIEYFSNLFSYDFPWDKYAQVAVYDFISGAMENTSISVFHEGLMKDKNSIGEYSRWNDDLIIAHELVHHWFGDLVTSESWANLTLNESFANYSEFLWLEKWKGREDAEVHWYENLQRYMNEFTNRGAEPIVQYYYDTPKEVFNRHRYEKGGMVLHLLRQYIGDEAFFEGLKYYLHQNAFSSTEVSQLRTAFEKVTGQDLNWFFNQWYFEAGHPYIEIEQKYDSLNHEVLLSFYQKQDVNYHTEVPIHKILFNVDFIYEDTTITHSITLTGKQTHLNFPSERVPLAINIDPGKLQLWEIVNHSPIEELKYIYQKSSKILDKAYVIDVLTKNKEFDLAAQILIPGFEQQHWFIQEKIVDIVGGFSNEYRSEVLRLLKFMLNSDFPGDRSAAIVQLKVLRDSDYFEIAKKHLAEDSSEYMKYICLNIILDSLGAENTYPYASQLLPAKNIYLRTAIAHVFSLHPESKDFSFFEELIFTMNRYFSRQIYTSFQTYLLALDDSVFQKGMELLTNIIQNEYPNERVQYARELLRNLSRLQVGSKGGLSSSKSQILKQYLIE
ncbi:MAG: M1 family metallopeptidase [Chitinophagales bacterium]|nr:M1 family metallopeptidase [Chitinophagales bacterium]